MGVCMCLCVCVYTNTNLSPQHRIQPALHSPLTEKGVAQSAHILHPVDRVPSLRCDSTDT